MPGRHGAVRANSSAEIGGVTTATVLVAPGEGRSAKEMASIAVHEAFHLYHGQAHPDWTADEGALMTYPADDAQVLTMRRCESEALRRALAAPAGGDEAVGWAAEALAWRAQRYERLGGPERAVERGIELREGLAQYVERKALGRLDGTTLPEEEYAPDAVRRRAYDVGQAIAVLLDRLHPGWADEINAAPSPALDVALQDALAPRAIPPRALPPDVVLAATRRAAADAAGHAAALARQRDEFLGRPGWTLRVVVEPGEEPLWPQAFDPMNLTALGGGAVLHSRWLRLGNAAGSIEILDRAALTRAAGSHPLFNGVRELTITGLPGAAPEIGANNASFDAEGILLRFNRCTIDRDPGAVTVRLGPS
jgi:hypothetical protein